MEEKIQKKKKEKKKRMCQRVNDPPDLQTDGESAEFF